MIKIFLTALFAFFVTGLTAQVQRYLYVADDQGWIHIYDINKNHSLVRKFEVPGTGEYKGISADATRERLYLSSYTGDQFVCVDLTTEKILYSIPVIGYPDSHAQTPDGKYVYPSSGDVIDASSKTIVAKIIESEKLLEIQFEQGVPVRAGTR